MTEFYCIVYGDHRDLHRTDTLFPYTTLFRSLLRRVLQNFVANAIRYAGADRPDRRVLIGCRRSGDRLRIVVCDNGRGIPADKRRTIFQEFARRSEEHTSELQSLMRI